MRTVRKDGGVVRHILRGMILDKTVCGRIAPRWKAGGLFDSPWANLIGGWCVDHFRKFESTISSKIKIRFSEWALSSEKSDSIVSSVESFLLFLSDEDSPVEVDYLLDQATRCFTRVALQQVAEQVEADVDAGDEKEAVSRVRMFEPVDLSIGSVVKPDIEYDPWARAFDDDVQRALVEYPGDLGKFFGRSLARGRLVSFMAPEKSGKTWWLVDLAFRAVKARNRVAYFDLGDLLEEEVLLRLGKRTTRSPVEPGIIDIPCGWDVVEGSDPVEYIPEVKSQSFESGLSASRAYKSFRKVCRGKDLFRLSCYANSTVSVADLKVLLSAWSRAGWRPDVVVLDYADILAPPGGFRETHDQVDEVWKSLRRLSQELHCLVVTATQTGAQAYGEKAKVLGKKHFSGRRTKFAHVNGMVGLNNSDADRRYGVSRLNWVVRRDDRYIESKVVLVAGSLDIGCVSIVSKLL